MIYTTTVFGHQKCFGWYRVLNYRVTGKEFRTPPTKIWALWAKRGNTPAHKGLVRTYTGQTYEEVKERGEGKESVD